MDPNHQVLVLLHVSGAENPDDLCADGNYAYAVALYQLSTVCAPPGSSCPLPPCSFAPSRRPRSAGASLALSGNALKKRGLLIVAECKV